jgi:hypothetical protein
MKTIEPTLKERSGRIYRQLLILRRLFPRHPEPEDVHWASTGDATEVVALCAAVGELLDELTAHARILTSVPFPLSEWRPGDGPDDERWRALTEIERREVLSIVAGYESLISWGEQALCGSNVVASRLQPVGEDLVVQPPGGQRGPREALGYLGAERARVTRFRQEMGFLEKRRSAQ